VRSVVVMAPRTLLCCLVLLGLCGCGAESARDEGSAPATRLTVRVDPDGKGPEPAAQSRVTCPGDPACAAVAKLRPADFEPVPGDVACTEQFGGPQTATVTGTLDGRDVDARFARTNGCEIARWEKVSAMLAEAG